MRTAVTGTSFCSHGICRTKCKDSSSTPAVHQHARMPRLLCKSRTARPLLASGIVRSAFHRPTDVPPRSDPKIGPDGGDLVRRLVNAFDRAHMQYSQRVPTVTKTHDAIYRMILQPITVLENRRISNRCRCRTALTQYSFRNADPLPVRREIRDRPKTRCSPH